MAEPWVTVRIGETLSLLQRLQGRAKHLKPVLDGPIANSIHAFFEKRFATEGSYGGEKWAPLSPRTQVWRSVFNRSAMPILQFSRELWGSLIKRSSPLGYRIADDDSLLLGTSVGHAEKHQLGTASMPARKIVPDEMPAEEQQTWSRLIVDYLEAA